MMKLRGGASAVILTAFLTLACMYLLGCGGGESKKASGRAEKVVPGVTKENVQKIKAGMSEKEVVEILGRWDTEESPLSGYKSQIWSKDGHKVTVFFDAEGKVTGEPIHDFGE